MPTFEVEVNGKVYEADAPDMASAAAAIKKFAAPAAPKQSALDSFLFKSNLSGAAGLGETALQMGTGLGGAVAGGLAGAGQMLYDAVSGRPEAEERAGDLTHRIQNAMTYQPRTQAGQAVSGVVTAPFQALASGADAAGGAVSDVAGPVAGAMVRMAPDAALMALGAKLPGAAAARATKTQAGLDVAKGQGAVLDSKIVAAKEAGFKLPPTLEGSPGSSTLKNKAIGTAAGPDVGNSLSIPNAKTANTLGRRALGVADDVSLSSETLGKMKAEAGKPYDALRQTGEIAPDAAYAADLNTATGKGSSSFSGNVPKAIVRLRKQYEKSKFTASEAVDAVKELRSKASKNIKSDLPAANDLGFAQRKIADALESQLERHAEGLGQPKLVAELKAARQQFAKIYSVEDALTPWGDVSPKVLARLQKRGVPLSAELKTIADMYDAFPSVMKDRHSIKPSTDYGVAAGLPRALAEFTVGPPARAIAGSDFVQGGVRPQNYSPSLAQELLSGYGQTSPASSVGSLGAAQTLSEQERRKRLAQLLK